MTDVIPEPDMGDLFDLIDCYVSPHRSEGLGLTVLEAMNAKKPVIATPYGGVADFVDSDTAIPLDFRLIEVGNGNAPYPPNFIWADPCTNSLRKAMRCLFEDRDFGTALGLRGHRKISEMFSLAQTGAAIRGRIDDIFRQSAVDERVVGGPQASGV
jgi:glycosyltransferase involved in cell wall biosynthesis